MQVWISSVREEFRPVQLSDSVDIRLLLPMRLRSGLLCGKSLNGSNERVGIKTVELLTSETYGFYNICQADCFLKELQEFLGNCARHCHTLKFGSSPT